MNLLAAGLRTMVLLASGCGTTSGCIFEHGTPAWSIVALDVILDRIGPHVDRLATTTRQMRSKR